MTSMRTILLATSLILLALPASADWKKVRIGDREYAALDDIAATFGMERAKPRKDKREIGFVGKAHQLVIKTGTREAIVDGVRHWLSFPVETQGKRPFVSMIDVNSTIGPAMSPASIKAVKPVKTIVFDPGHGGHDRGARSSYGVEKDYTLDVVKRTRRILESRKIKVVQSRLSDFFASLNERPAMVANYDDPVFVSIHFNAASWRPSANGTEIYVLPPFGCPVAGKDPVARLDNRESDGDAVLPASFVFANTMHHTILGKTGSFDRGVKRARFAVLRHCSVPAILIECGFLTNAAEAKSIHNPTWRETYAEAIADGIEAYMALANERKLPPRIWDYGRKSTDEFVWED